MRSDKLLFMVGIAMKSGNVVSGEFSTEKAVKSGKAKLVIVADDASDNTKKLFRDKCSYYEVPFITYATKTDLGRAIGKEFRASVGIIDAGIAKTIIKISEERTDGE